MIFRSPTPEAPFPEVSLPQFMLGRLAQWGEKAALIDGPTGRTLSYGELARQIRAVAGGLAARGFGRGDVCAIYAANCPQYAVAFYAVALLGGTNTTINPLFTGRELAGQLADAGARSLVTTGALLEKALPAAREAGVREVYTFDGAPDTTPFAALAAAGAVPPHTPIDPARDVVALPYSSGTTGLPKGVMLTHRNLVANLHQMEAAPWFRGVGADDVVVAVMPFFHIYGMVVVMGNALARGATLVTLPRYEPEPFLEALQHYGVTYCYVVPPIVLQLAKLPAVERYDLSRVRTLFSGAAPLGEGLEAEATARLGCDMVQGYGMTEASPVTHLCPDDPALYRPGSVGLVAPGTEVQVVDVAGGRPLGPGEQGELWIRGPQIMKGYLGRPEETEAAVDGEGWYHSGDIGRVDEDGYTYVVDRLKELIKYKGYQVAPAELEALLLTHPAVADAAVIPSPDAEAGEVPKAFVVPQAGADAHPEALMAWIAGEVAPYKRVRRLELTDHIPKSPSGKILRRVLVQAERERAAG